MSIKHQDNSKVGWSQKYEDNFKKIDWGKDETKEEKK